VAEKPVTFMAKCLDCPKPATPWEFQTYDARATWVGQHRLKTGHSVNMWLEVL